MKPDNQSERLWTAEQVAHYLGVSKSWVYRAATDGTLPALRLGGVVRFDAVDVRDWTKHQKHGLEVSHGA